MSIRGTLSVLDALRDFTIEPSSFQGGLVHSGMRDQANEVITQLKPTIDRILANHSDYQLIFTGHSLGAGAASIATLILQNAYPSVHAYCFANPSCVSIELLPRLERCVISIENMSDLVQRMNSSAMHTLHTLFSDVDWKHMIELMIEEYRKHDNNFDIMMKYKVIMMFVIIYYLSID